MRNQNTKKTEIYTIEQIKEMNYNEYTKILKKRYKNFKNEILNPIFVRIDPNDNLKDIDTMLKYELLFNLRTSSEIIYTKSGIEITRLYRNSEIYEIGLLDYLFEDIDTEIKNYEFNLSEINFKTPKKLKEELNRIINNRLKKVNGGWMDKENHFFSGQMYINVLRAKIVENRLIFKAEVTSRKLDYAKVYDYNLIIKTEIND